jgi:hypothetical protein
MNRRQVVEEMRIRAIKRWVSPALALLLILSYRVYRGRMIPDGGTPAGLAYGIAGLCFIAFLLFQAVRKRWHRCHYGKNETWVDVHIHAGLLAPLLIGMHAGFQFRDPSATLAAALLGGIVLSGLLGLFLYRLLPRRLHAISGSLTIEEAAEEMNQLSRKMCVLAQGKSQPLRQVWTFLSEAHTLGRWAFLGLAKTQNSDLLVQHIQGVPVDEQAVLDQMILLDQQWKRMQAQFGHRMWVKNLLVAWLYLHVPLSAALVVAILLHLLMVAYY